MSRAALSAILGCDLGMGFLCDRPAAGSLSLDLLNPSSSQHPLLLYEPGRGAAAHLCAAPSAQCLSLPAIEDLSSRDCGRGSTAGNAEGGLSEIRNCRLAAAVSDRLIRSRRHIGHMQV